MKRLIAIAPGLAMVVLVWSAGAPITRAATADDDARVAAGKKLTVDTCANDHCHGGSATSFDDMKGVTDARIRKVIAEGLPDSSMPPFRGVFTPEQVDSIVAYVLSASSTAPAPVASHEKTGPSRR